MNSNIRQTQKETILNYLQKHGSISNEEARRVLGISRGATERVEKLRKEGHLIDCYRDHHNLALYTLNKIPSIKFYHLFTMATLSYEVKYATEITMEDLKKRELYGKVKLAEKKAP